MCFLFAGAALSEPRLHLLPCMTILVCPPELGHTRGNVSETWSAWRTPPEIVTTRSCIVLLVLKALWEPQNAVFYTHIKAASYAVTTSRGASGAGTVFITLSLHMPDNGIHGTKIDLIRRFRISPKTGRNLAVFILLLDYTRWTCMVACFPYHTPPAPDKLFWQTAS